MNLKKICLIIIFLVSHAICFSQKISPLKIGDKVPDIVLAKMINHIAPSGKLSDFKGKAIIIDQWFIACAPCVSSMRHMDTLQSKYSKDLIVLPVTFEKEKDVKDFWAQNLMVKGLKFPQVIEDTLVRKYFPAVSFPQHIFINKSGIVVAITDGNTTNIATVTKLINGTKLNLELKIDEMDAHVRYALMPDILIRYEENKRKILHYSYFSKYRKEFSSMSKTELDTTNNLVRIINNNATLFWLYDFAYANNSREIRNFNSRFIRKDTKQLKSLPETNADTTSMFCYDLMYSGNNVKGFSKFMVPDLDRFFGIKSHEEMLDVPCYVITTRGNGKKFGVKYQPERKSYYEVNLIKEKKIIANDVSILLLSKAINSYSDQLVLLEIDDAKKVNFEVCWLPHDLEKMNVELARFDLKIENTSRKRKVIVLEDE